MVGFSRKHRLISQQAFRRVWEHPSKIKLPYGFVFFRENQQDCARIGIIVKKQAVNLATRRNMLRRIVRESFRSHSLRFEGLDLIVLLRAECNRLDKKTIRVGIDQLWQHVLANHSKVV